MECLFIGGFKDGCRIEVETPGRPMKFSVPPDRSFLLSPSAWDGTNMKFQIVTYLPVTLAGQKEKFTVYVVEGMTGDSLMEKLISSYPRPVEKR